MILAVAVLTEGLAPFAFKVDRRGVEEDQIQPAEQVARLLEQGLFDQVLDGTGSEGRGAGLLVFWKRFSQPGHRSIKVMQLKLLHAFDGVLLPPDFGRSIAARGEQPVQNRQEHGPLDIELEFPLCEQSL